MIKLKVPKLYIEMKPIKITNDTPHKRSDLLCIVNILLSSTKIVINIISYNRIGYIKTLNWKLEYNFL